MNTEQLLKKMIKEGAKEEIKMLEDSNKALEELLQTERKRSAALDEELGACQGVIESYEDLEDKLDEFAKDMVEMLPDLGEEMHSILDNAIEHVAYELGTTVRDRIKDIRAGKKDIAKLKKAREKK